MADSIGQADIRGIDIDKLAKGYADEELILQKFLSVSPTGAREIRWYQKTAGFLDTTDSTGITTSNIANMAPKARPFVIEPSWTRTTSYVQKFIAESPFIPIEDINDSDIDVLASCVRDVARGVAKQVELRQYAVLTESFAPSNINSRGVSGSGWALASGSPIYDIMYAKQQIRSNGYNPEGAVVYMNPTDHLNMLNWLISTKGSSIPSFSSQRVQDGVVMEILGCQVIVSQNATAGAPVVFVPNRAATWKEFISMTTRSIEEVGIGQKIRCWTEGECLLTDPKAVCLLFGV